ncbi:putative receptor binding protein assembly chaperone [Campylobacter phage F358]|uniref:Putative receptor binding protein assembly chaperone n=9 Tax=Fletchervirus CPX TaxID=1110702 RepID=A0A7T3N2K6_9CAUD|nr:putative receptor binding protein assembly chaperone [Campylobacter phage F348]QPX63339.1 putative receptor binding protein assembly chaperone [Campylobacter phage F352]QPX63843.1 putative receptor binding protein assembly chaperone [Campylobacter phage F357]QPX64007.1 putative receptor binding protein assembly chaperone [Campylobacter phage F358]QPX64169.1 putative receptor binding protein assembly chaperone [Campylobacter phage F360]QPX64498.1 putative receptor binding protein assembly ch
MIISKKTLADQGQLNKNVILWAIDIGSELALLNRPMTVRQNSENMMVEYIDDITPEEIEAGKQAIKEYCISNNIMDIYYDFLIATTQESNKLDILKEKKRYEIQSNRDKALENGIVYNGHTFQTREKDKLNINGAVTNLMLDIQSGTNSVSEIIWIDINDEKVTFNPQEFLKFTSMVAYNTQEITFKANVLKAKIEAAKTIEELEKIQWDDSVKTTQKKR